MSETNNDSATVIPVATTVKGSLTCPGDLEIHGDVVGDVSAGGQVKVFTGSVCRAEIRARGAIICGEVFGNVICTQRIAVRGGGRVVGDVRAPDVRISRDGSVEGTIAQKPPTPAHHEPTRYALDVHGAALLRPTVPPRPLAAMAWAK